MACTGPLRAPRRMKHSIDDEDCDAAVNGRIQIEACATRAVYASNCQLLYRFSIWRLLNENEVALNRPLTQMDFASLKPQHVHPVDLRRVVLAASVMSCH
jgi:hypothetical protein